MALFAHLRTRANAQLVWAVVIAIVPVLSIGMGISVLNDQLLVDLVFKIIIVTMVKTCFAMELFVIAFQQIIFGLLI